MQAISEPNLRALSGAHPNRPQTGPDVTADARPGHPRNATRAQIIFTDWAMI